MKYQKRSFRKTASVVSLTAEYLMAFIAYFILMKVNENLLLGTTPAFEILSFIRFLVIASVSAFTVALVNLYAVIPLTRKLSFLRSVLLGALIYTVAALAGIFLYASIEHAVMITGGLGYSDFIAESRLFLRFEFFPLLLFLLLVSFPIRILHVIVNRIGLKNILDVVSDRYRVAHEEERVFMFMDLYGSTTAAEKLGHVRYHDLLDEVFNDISDVLLRYSGEVYQYVGDAVVVTWDIRQGTDNMNCVRCFFEIQATMEELAEKYWNTYNYKPWFKAGMHSGKVIAGEVGDFKKEVAFHGDTVNTASRIQAACLDFNAHLLVSEELFLSFPVGDLREFRCEFIGCIRIKGRLNDICIYRIET
jgi:adenylate cyclase